MKTKLTIFLIILMSFSGISKSEESKQVDRGLYLGVDAGLGRVWKSNVSIIEDSYMVNGFGLLAGYRLPNNYSFELIASSYEKLDANPFDIKSVSTSFLGVGVRKYYIASPDIGYYLRLGLGKGSLFIESPSRFQVGNVIETAQFWEGMSYQFGGGVEQRVSDSWKVGAALDYRYGGLESNSLMADKSTSVSQLSGNLNLVFDNFTTPKKGSKAAAQIIGTILGVALGYASFRQYHLVTGKDMQNAFDSFYLSVLVGAVGGRCFGGYLVSEPGERGILDVCYW